MSVTRIDRLSDEERARFDEWADRWIEIGLRTGPADRARFESAVRDCYRYAGISFPEVVVWVPSPLVLSIAAPVAALLIEMIETDRRRQPARRSALLSRRRGAVRGAVSGAVRDAVSGAVSGAVDGAVSGAVGDAVRDAVNGAVDDAVGDAVGGAVRDAVNGAVRGAVGGAVDGAVNDAVRGAVRDAVRGAVGDAVSGAVGGAVDGAVNDAAIRRGVADVVARGWSRIIGGQFWVGYWYWGGSRSSFFREVCGLELPGDLWDRGRSYEATMESACWWWPHRRFVMVSERPLEIHRELVDPSRVRGWGSHRLHRDDGPAVVWPDGWGVHSVHGVRVPRQVVEAPETLTVEQIGGERNAEVRRIMIDRFGAEKYLNTAGGRLVSEDEWGKLWRLDQADDEPLVMVEVVNSTAETDGTFKDYFLRVPPTMRTAHEAVAWTFGMTAAQYDLEVAT